MKHLLAAMLGMAAASMQPGDKPLLKTLDDEKPSNQYPFSEEEKEKLASFTNIKEKKKYIKELKAKYAQLARKENA